MSRHSQPVCPPASDTSQATTRTAISTSTKGKDDKKVEVKRRPRRHFDKRDWSFLSFDYKTIDWSREEPPKPLSSMSIYEQESALVQDLLHVLVGIEGKYIRLQPTPDSSKKNILVVDDQADKLLKTLACKIIAICPMYSSVVHFADENDHGLVNQALAAAMRGVIKDYFTLVAQLESQFRKRCLTMQKMWYYIQPHFVQLEILKHFSSCINNNNVSGGAVLSILHDKTKSLTGNVKSLDFCLQVTRDACVPYFEILERWITHGLIVDPYNEFFVEDVYSSRADETLIHFDDDSFWEKRYRINPSKMPNFLSCFQDKILNTGKYLSVIRECGHPLERPALFSEQLEYTTEEKAYIERIESAHQSASRQLLDLLLRDCDLLGHLHSIKHFFFMDQGDYVVQFMDTAEDELSKDIDSTNPKRLASLLELAMRTSVMKGDPHHEDVGIQLVEESILTQLSNIMSMGRDERNVFHDSAPLKAFEGVTLSYAVKWPLSLILGHRTIACYQMIFRHLFLCKYVERQLQSVWKDNKQAKSYPLKAVTGYAEAFALRQKMLNFVQNLSHFMTVEVIEPHFQVFIEKIHSFSQLDEMSREHTKFVESCLRDCMLTSEFALQFMVKLLNLCLSFSEFMQVCNHFNLNFLKFNSFISPGKSAHSG